jgi:tetratricopeptide (TPR) repeat protein/predicted Ser/Thr protein kinase
MTGPTVGSQVSHYRLERVLGAGGMGQVFLARDLTLDRPVAIKFLIAAQDEHARKRLLAEARSVAALDHPSICTVHEVVTDEAIGDFIVMNYIEGETLATRLRRGRLTPTETMALMVPLLQALGTAHRAGVVHRDIKPQNIVLTPTGLPKLLDFGIAKRILPESSTEDATTATMLTGDGDVVGTLAYMSPEQLQARSIDARSDLFSLGSVLFECLTGQRAFAGASRAETIGQLLHVDPPAPSSVVPDLAPTFDALCADMLRKVPAERFQTAEEVLGVIRGLSPTQRMAAERDVPPPMRFQVTKRHVRLAAFGVVVAAVVAIAWVVINRPTPLAGSTPDAARWFDAGVAKLREGSYTGAKSALEEAVRISPDFVLAHLRLAEANAELEDSEAARQALLRVTELVPPNVSLRLEDQLRLDAVRSSVLRNHERAIEAYRQLAERTPNDASAWLDVGRAEDAAGRRVAAMEHFALATKLDGQYAAAHQRLGVLQSQGGQRETALASLAEAIRLHQAGGNVEGEAEATLRKASVHIARRELSDATTALARMEQLAAGPQFRSLQVRTRFERARVAQADGRFAEAEELSRGAVDDAVEGRMGPIASDGLRGLATILMVAGKFDEADLQLGRAIEVAVEQRAGRAEMQARLQRAVLRVEQGRYAEAIAEVEQPLQFCTTNHYVRNEAEAKSILARAHESLEHYDQAKKLASEVLTLAESIDDQVLIGVSLDNLAGQADRLGQLPEALGFRDRLESMHRANNDHVLLAFDLLNRGDLMIRLGMIREGTESLDQIDKMISEGHPAYEARRRGVAVGRATRLSILENFAEVEAAATPAFVSAAGAMDDASLTATVLTEHARARMGRSRAAPGDIAAWPARASTPALGRELAYWVGRTLFERKAFDRAFQVTHGAWSAAPAKNNLELRWRLAALAAQALDGAPGAPGGPTSATMRTLAREDLQVLLKQWAAHGPAYASRPDVAGLRKGL